jgi:hypothetical protein
MYDNVHKFDLHSAFDCTPSDVLVHIFGQLQSKLLAPPKTPAPFGEGEEEELVRCIRFNDEDESEERKDWKSFLLLDENL